MDEKQKQKVFMDDLETLEMFVDYAMIEGANLKLPLIVYLLQMVQVEVSSVKHDNIRSIGKPSIKN